MERSVQRSKEILDKLTDYEKGKVENVGDLVRHFRDFVIATTKQEEERRKKEIDVEERRMKQAAEGIERKKRLEKLLVDLNEKIKTEPTVIPKQERDLPIEAEVSDKNKFEPRVKQGLLKSDSGDQFQTPSGSSDKRPPEKNLKFRKTSRDSRELKVRKSGKRLRKQSVSSELSYESSESAWSFYSNQASSADSDRPRRVQERGRREVRQRDRREHQRPLKRIPMSEWRIKYDGKDGGRRLAEFLKEVKMRRRAEIISDRELFRGAIHLFSGRAKDWFIEGMKNRDFRNWGELKSELKREFLPPDLDFQLEIQATNRRQARGEKFVDYLHDILKRFQSMTRPISERRKFEIIWRNMRFDYKNWCWNQVNF
ncbi:eukaryotic translation initiation factor 3 subunit A-like [Aedes albopictus]|uniref:Retrotransposon gag domain-containing protein n=1 Tax=Aedes albopictus TaxID=7160 RepID=A0ABM1ZHG1_AEDAL